MTYPQTKETSDSNLLPLVSFLLNIITSIILLDSFDDVGCVVKPLTLEILDCSLVAS